MTNTGAIGSSRKSRSCRCPTRPADFSHWVLGRLWVIGFSFVFFGSLFDFAALAFAAQSIVATVSS